MKKKFIFKIIIDLMYFFLIKLKTFSLERKYRKQLGGLIQKMAARWLLKHIADFKAQPRSYITCRA